MKGSHTVEGFIAWLDNQENIDFITKLNFKRHLKKAADRASATGQYGEVQIKSKDKHIASIRVFDDGSCALGFDPEITKKPGFMPPSEKEM